MRAQCNNFKDEREQVQTHWSIVPNYKYNRAPTCCMVFNERPLNEQSPTIEQLDHVISVDTTL